MALWNWILRRQAAPSKEDGEGQPGATRLPSDPLVFECQLCGKVFEGRRLHPSCPECDANDVALLTEIDE